MSNVNSVSPKLNIVVNDRGSFLIDGHATDLTGLIFKVQQETGDIAQERLAFTAKELWDANNKTKRLVFLLDKIRALRPSHKATDKASGDKFDALGAAYYDAFGGGDPFREAGVSDLGPSTTTDVYQGKSTHVYKELEKDDPWDFLNKDDYATYLNSVPLGTRVPVYFKNKHLFILGDDSHVFRAGEIGDGSSIMVESQKSGWWRLGDPVYIKKSSGSLKQAEIDQLIEGVKAQISNVGSKQEMLQTDTQRYTRVSDETKEAMAAIEKAIASAIVQLESKI